MWWERAGRNNTEATVKLAAATAKEKGIKHIVIASNRGDTALALWEQKPEAAIVCVTHQIGFTGNGVDEMGEAMRKNLADKNIKVYTGTHLFGGVNRSLRRTFSGVYPGEIIAQTLRLLGEGTKVAVEIAVMALDAGYIPYGEEIISIGGTARGADTALILKPAHSSDFLSTEIMEIICKPYNIRIKD